MADVSCPPNFPWLSTCMTVKDVKVAADFYKKAFQFVITDLVMGEDDTYWHGELRYKDGVVMIGKEGAWGNTNKTPANSKIQSPINHYVYCEDVDKFYQSAIEAGAKAVSAPEKMFWGDRMCRLEDLDGYVWCFATFCE